MDEVGFCPDIDVQPRGPAMNEPLEFRFTVPPLPDGQAVTAEEFEEIALKRLESDSSSRKQTLWDLSVIYSATRREEQSLECLRKLAVLTEDLDQRAQCYLAMGAQRERARDFEGAVTYYGAAFEMSPSNSNVWYWINNNLGYSLVQLGRCQEAERYLREAIGIDQGRSNAYKNLGLAFLGQARWTDAAAYFVRATQANASDNRSLAHLEQLVSEHPEILVDLPELERATEQCREAVRLAASAQPDTREHWRMLRNRQRKPWWAFWR